MKASQPFALWPPLKLLVYSTVEVGKPLAFLTYFSSDMDWPFQLKSNHRISPNPRSRSFDRYKFNPLSQTPRIPFSLRIQIRPLPKSASSSSYLYSLILKSLSYLCCSPPFTSKSKIFGFLRYGYLRFSLSLFPFCPSASFLSYHPKCIFSFIPGK